MVEPTTALVADDFQKSFGVLEVLKGVSLTAHDGDVISIIGNPKSERCRQFLASSL